MTSTADADTAFKQGFTQHQAGHLAEAEALYAKVLQLQPRHFDALHLSGVIALQGGDHGKAARLIDQAIAVAPDSPATANAYRLRGDVLSATGQHQAALESYDRAVALNPNHPVYFYGRGTMLMNMARYEDARTAFARAVEIKPDFAEAQGNLGAVLAQLRRHAEALHAFDAALRAKPNFALAHINRGLTLWEMNRPLEALAACDAAIALTPDSAKAHFYRANALNELKRFEEAVAAFDIVLRLKPDMPFAAGTRLHTKMRICDWSDLGKDIADLSDRLARGEQCVPPFSLLSMTDSPALHRKAAEVFAGDKSRVDGRKPFRTPRRPGKIRVGYVSMDFRNHPVAYLLAHLIEVHDRAAFEIHGFSLSPEAPDDLRARLVRAFDTFHDVAHKTGAEIAAQMRAMEIDIAVDLTGYTSNARTGTFAQGLAPIQVNYLGYPGTMGVPYMDYIIADAIVIPEESRQHYAEKVVTLPHSYQANDAMRLPAGPAPARVDLGLPTDGFVYCCFNNSFKILPEIFDIWMRILDRTPGSVLWLLEDNPHAVRNLRVEAEQRGVAGARLIFAPRTAVDKHLARHGAADLFLDTLPYTAHTTASDALWAGLPLLTCPGESFPARVAASLLTAVEMPELIAATLENYEALAVALAADPQRLARLKQRLAEKRRTAPLFDTGLFARHIENAFTQMVARREAGLLPDHLRVDA